MDVFFKLITWCGSLLVLLPVCIAIAVLLYCTQRKAEAALLLGGLLGASVLAHLLKLLFARPRPTADQLLVTMPADYSFPSAHTAQIVACSLAVSILSARQLSGPSLAAVWAISLLLASLVGYSRIYLKVHYLSDVLAGSLLGLCWVILLARLLK